MSAEFNTDKLYLPHGPPLLTAAGVRRGIRVSIPYTMGAGVFGLTAGILASKAGVSLGAAVFMNAIVYAGAAQLAALAHWPDVLNAASLLGLVLLVLTINSRYVLMGASLYPYFRHLPLRQSLALLSFNGDFLWIVFLREAELAKANGTRIDLGFYVGFGIAAWFVWTLVAIPGWFMGSAISDLKRLALDLFALMFFSALIVPMWKGFAHARPWAVAAAAAALSFFIVPGSYYIVIGAIAGSIYAGVTRQS